jgi:hypothetical protein
VIHAQAQTPFAIRGRTLLGAIALIVALGLSAAGGYAVGDASARATQQAAVGAYPIQLGPASRWTHEEQPFTPIQLGPALRSTHEEP